MEDNSFKKAQLLFNEGLKLFEKNEYDLAENLFRESLKLMPGRLTTIINLTAVLIKKLKYEEAIQLIDQVMVEEVNDPVYSKLYVNQGNAFKGLGKSSQAASSYYNATIVDPNCIEALNNYGVALREIGSFDEAEENFKKCINLDPGYADAHSNLGILMQEKGELNLSNKCLSHAITLSPNISEYYCNLSVTLRLQGQYKNAEVLINKAIQLNNNDPISYCILGNILVDIGNFTEAILFYRKAISINPELTEAHSNLLLSMNYSFSDISLINSREQAKKFGNITSKSAKPKFNKWNKPNLSSKIRVGFVSGDFRRHPVGYFLQGLLNKIDRKEFDIFGFTTNYHEDKLTENIKFYFNKWTNIYDKSDFEAASIINSMSIHILIDLSGHTEHNRLKVFSYKPSPIQVSWLGYFATTGLPEMDYFLGDKYIAPDSEQKNFTEKLINLKDTWFCFTPPIEPIKVSNLPALKNGYITFGSFANSSKITSEIINVWAEILNNIPNSKLFIKSRQFSDINNINELKSKFLKYRINNSRLIIEGPSTIGEYYLKYNNIDIVLDTFPYPGGTTSIDALWMGVPVLTLKGDCFLGRLGESIANNAGQPDWIAQDMNEYVKKALIFSSDYGALANLRKNLRGKVIKTPLFDCSSFAFNFGSTLKDICFNHLYKQ